MKLTIPNGKELEESLNALVFGHMKLSKVFIQLFQSLLKQRIKTNVPDGI